MKRLAVVVAIVAFVFTPMLAAAAPVTLPSGQVLELSQAQVETIKEHPGVFYSKVQPETLPGQTMVALPDELGGGYIYGSPEVLAQAVTGAGAAIGATSGAVVGTTGATIITGVTVAGVVAGAVAAAAAATSESGTTVAHQ